MRFEDEAMKQFGGVGEERKQRIAAEASKVAKEIGRSPAQVALAWLRTRDVPVMPIIGARKVDQLRDNLACLDLNLDREQVGRLDRVGAIESGFPESFFGKEMVRTFAYGGMRDRIDA